jgi:hypothetical protein
MQKDIKQSFLEPNFIAYYKMCFNVAFVIQFRLFVQFQDIFFLNIDIANFIPRLSVRNGT